MNGPKFYSRVYFIFLFITTLAFLTSPAVNAQQAGAADTGFNTYDIGFGFGDSGPGVIESMFVQPDGKIFSVGTFFGVHGSNQVRVSRLNGDGTIDSSFAPNPTQLFPNGAQPVYSAAMQPDGKYLIGGAFHHSVAPNRVARLHADGSPDLSFTSGTGTGPNGIVRKVLLQPDGKVLIAGAFTSFDGISRSRIARINADGTLDTGFDPGSGANGLIRTMALQPDGNILIGGDFTNYNGTNCNRLARLLPDGSLDVSFSTGTGFTGATSVVVACLELQSDGRILAGGGFTSYNGSPANRIIRLLPNGSQDISFNSGTGANSDVLSIALQADGRLTIGGGFTNYNGITRNRLARIFPNGTLDNSLVSGTGFENLVKSIVVLPNGRILAAGDFGGYQGVRRIHLVRLFSNGTIDYGFKCASGANNGVEHLLVLPDGKLIIAGPFRLFNGKACNSIARLFPDGNLDTTFAMFPGPSTSGVHALALQPDGKIIVGGYFTQYAGVPRNKIARLYPDGTLDLSFNPGSGIMPNLTSAYLLRVQPDGKILIGGGFTSYNGVTRNRIARLNPDGSLDTSFDPGLGPNTPLMDLCLLPDGKIMIGGAFTSYNGTARGGIARLHSNGALDLSFDPGTGVSIQSAGSSVKCILSIEYGQVLINGNFMQYNGLMANGVARLNPDGSLDTGFTLSGLPTGTKYSMLRQPDGKYIIEGNFVIPLAPTLVRMVYRIHADGSHDSSFDNGTGAENEISVMRLQEDGKIVIGGAFVSVNGIGRNRLARLHGTTPIQISTGPSSNTSFCQGASVVVPFSVTGTLSSATTFTAQLSNASGSFQDPVVIGSVIATGSGSINGLIPANTPPSTSYRIRVVAQVAYQTTDNGINLEILSLPSLAATVSASAICQGSSAFLNASGASSYTWLGPEITTQSGATATANPTSAGLYTYTVTGFTAGCSASAIMNVTVHPVPLVSASASAVNICSGQSITLSATGALNYTWNHGQSGAIIQQTPATGTTFTVIGTTVHGCSDTATVAIDVNPLPVLSFSATPAVLCQGQSSILTGSGAASYSWSTGASGSDLTVIPTATTTYSLTGTSAEGCSQTVGIQVTVNPLPAITASASGNIICNGQNTSLSASGASTYNWSNGQTGATISVSPGFSTNYSVTGTSAQGCSNSASITVTVHELPTISTSAVPAVICEGQTSILTATGANIYSWSSSQSGSSIPVSPSGPTTYTVFGTSAQGCTSTASVSLQVNPLPQLTLLPTQPAICNGQSTSLTAVGADSYSWSSGQTGSIISINPVTTTSFTVWGTNTLGCSNSTSTSIQVNPTPDVAASSASGCIGSTLNFTASGTPGSAFAWTGPGGFHSSQLNPELQNLAPAMAGTYTLAANLNGCTNYVMADVLIKDTPEADFTYQISRCCGISIIDASSGGLFYHYDFGDNTSADTSANPQHHYSRSGTYTIKQTVTNAAGCTASTTRTVTIQHSGQIAIYPNPSSGQVTIDLTELEEELPVQVDVYSIIGQHMMSRKIQSSRLNQLSVDGLAAGTYPVRVQLQDRVLMVNLVVQH